MGAGSFGCPLKIRGYDVPGSRHSPKIEKPSQKPRLRHSDVPKASLRERSESRGNWESESLRFRTKFGLRPRREMANLRFLRSLLIYALGFYDPIDKRDDAVRHSRKILIVRDNNKRLFVFVAEADDH